MLFNSLDINGSMIKMSQICIAFIYKVIDYYCVYLQGGHCMFLLGLFACRVDRHGNHQLGNWGDCNLASCMQRNDNN